MTTNKKKVAILLATYNGERYIKEQLDSLYAQTYKDWILYVHDDGSSDDTMEILKDYQQKHNNIMILDYPPTGGAKNNFLSLLQKVEADYYFFSDQDDVWSKEKVSLSLKKMLGMEHNNPSKPIVVFCDLYVVDRNLDVIDKSFFDHDGIHPEFLTTFPELGASSICPGCAMAFNKKAKESIIFPADKAIMHDSWTVLCTLKAGGMLGWIKKPLIKYRQHGDNTQGARDIKDLTLSYRFANIRKIIRMNINYFKMLRSLGYGSVIKFLWSKILYKYRIIKSRKSKLK